LIKLNKMYKQYSLPLELYGKIRQSLTVNYGIEQEDDLYQFVEDLPVNLKIKATFYLHNEMYRSIKFLQDKTIPFITWICPVLR
jgi:hypothetical protein